MACMVDGAVARRPVQGAMPRAREEAVGTSRIQPSIHEGIWAGRRCFIVGGGPSLRGFDWDLLKGELVIGVNRAYEFCTPSIIFSIDKRYWSWVQNEKYGAAAKERFNRLNVEKVWVNTGFRPEMPTEGYSMLPMAQHHGIADSLTNGIPTGENSGYAAINFAYLLGATQIYLLGFDMHGEGGKQAHHHSGHPIMQPDSIYADKFLPYFDELAERLASADVQVTNLSPESSLHSFPKGTVGDVPFSPERRPLVIGYYTKDTSYEEEIKGMVRSARLYGLEVDVRGIDTLGGWQKNTYYKATFIRQMLDEHPGRDLLFLDADLEIKAYPLLFDALTAEPSAQADMAVSMVDWSTYKRNHRTDKELNTSVMWFRNDYPARYFLGAWIAENEKRIDSGVWEQKVCQDVLELMHNIHVELLPDSYCQIFDLMAERGEPVIELHQASRKFKSEVGP